MGLIDLVLDFCDGYSSAHRNLDNSPEDNYRGVELSNQNLIAITGSLAALMVHPKKTARYIRNHFFPYLMDEIESSQELRGYSRLRCCRDRLIPQQ